MNHDSPGAPPEWPFALATTAGPLRPGPRAATTASPRAGSILRPMLVAAATPALSLGRLAGGGALEIERSVMFDVLGLLTLPSRSRIAEGRFDQAQLQAAADAVAVAQQARQAWFDAVAAQQLETYARQVMEA